MKISDLSGALGFAPEFQRNGILWDYYIRAEA
jgi:hypothetical protein